KQQPLTANHNTPHAGIHCAILNQHHTAPTPPRAGSRCDGNTGSPGYGGHSGGETPGPIPNPEAKPSSADGTAPARVWESRTPPTTTPPHKGPPPPGAPYYLSNRNILNNTGFNILIYWVILILCGEDLRPCQPERIRPETRTSIVVAAGGRHYVAELGERIGARGIKAMVGGALSAKARRRRLVMDCVRRSQRTWIRTS